MIQTLLSATLLTLLAGPTLGGDHEGWFDDYDQAVAAAEEQGKDLFVDFTGSDWCGWCKRLKKEVFDHDEFMGPAQADFVLVALDFPRSEEAKAAVPNPERNQELNEKYGIRGYPTCLLMNTDGVVFGRMGYQEGGPVQYVEDMRATLSEGKRLLAQLKELQAEYAAAEDKQPVLKKAIALLEDMDGESPGVSIVADMVRGALKLDSDNSKGLQVPAMRSLLVSGQADDGLRSHAAEMDSRNELGLLELVIQGRFGMVRDDDTAKLAIASVRELLAIGTYHDVGEVQRMVAMAAMWSEGPLQDHDNAVELAKKALAMDGELDDRMKEMLEGLLE